MKTKTLVQPITALTLVQIPLWFVWHTELVFNYTGANLTNGFTSFNGLQIYHILLYMLFITCNIAAFVILKNWKNQGNNSKN